MHRIGLKYKHVEPEPAKGPWRQVRCCFCLEIIKASPVSLPACWCFACWLSCCQVDFLLTAMRELAVARPDLKLLLMSASVNAAGLMEYFEGTVPGRQLYSRPHELRSKAVQ